MKFIQMELPGIFLIEPEIYTDERGYFFESFRSDRFKQEVGDIEFVQENESKSAYGVLRGLHYQLPPFEQSKLVRIVRGQVLDVAVDIRRSSPHFLQHIKCELSDENKRQLFIPAGFAHAFLVLSDGAVVQYKVDKYYSKEHERGITYNDPGLDIRWEVHSEDLIVSSKDAGLPTVDKVELFD